MKQFVFATDDERQAVPSQSPPRRNLGTAPMMFSRPFRVSQAYIEDVMQKIGIAQQALERACDQRKDHFEKLPKPRDASSNTSYSHMHDAQPGEKEMFLKDQRQSKQQ